MEKERRQQLIIEYQLNSKDTGSPEVQVVLLSNRISELSAHLKVHKKDSGCRTGLLGLVGRRRRILKYLHSVDVERYRTLVARLGLRQ
ncbi:MAG: 30S ribosomal protein S15 [Chloroflexi bacterium]|nr:30S ribosomal protein S15 [Chloroflexota bacterium]